MIDTAKAKRLRERGEVPGSERRCRTSKTHSANFAFFFVGKMTVWLSGATR
jgi:hypothetical protein